jgi:hypothetical protein
MDIYVHIYIYIYPQIVDDDEGGHFERIVRKEDSSKGKQTDEGEDEVIML